MALLKPTPLLRKSQCRPLLKLLHENRDSWKRDFCESFSDFSSNPKGKILHKLYLVCAVSRLFSLALSHLEGFLIIMYGCLSDCCASGFIEARHS